MTQYRVAMDIGGTFTDVVTYDEDGGVFTAGKASTTPGDLSEGVLAGLEGMVPSAADIGFLVHGTTQGLNAFLERRGVPVLLLATDGVEDAYHIARGPRTRLYDLHYRKPTPLVPRRDVIGIPGRISYDGKELTPLDEDAVRLAAVRAKEGGLGAIAVAFLFSYANPAHELRARDILAEELGSDFTVTYVPRGGQRVEGVRAHELSGGRGVHRPDHPSIPGRPRTAFGRSWFDCSAARDAVLRWHPHGRHGEGKAAADAVVRPGGWRHGLRGTVHGSPAARS